ncbi:MAG TPA: hypothetical protein VKE88_02440 [Candidatus Nanoarchaeia archaeon]|nr:hypothetical protein [Candidatus Nanoarchaeia archaeon]
MKKFRNAVTVALFPLVLGTGCTKIVKTGMGIGAPGLSEIERDFAATAVVKGQDAALDLLKDPTYKQNLNKNFQDRIEKMTPEQWADLLDTAGLPPAFSGTAKTMLTNIVSKNEQGKKDAAMLTSMAAMSPLAQQQTISPVPVVQSSISPSAQLALQPRTQSPLPFRSESDEELSKRLEGLSVVYASQNKVYEQSLRDGKTTDLSSSFSGFPVSMVKSFPGSKNVFFVSNGNLYVLKDDAQKKISLIEENIQSTEFESRQDFVVYRRGNAVKKVKLSGAHKEEVMRGIDDLVSELIVSPSGAQAIVKLTPKMKQGSSSLFNKARYAVVNLAAKNAYDEVDTPVDKLFWNDDTSVLFVRDGELYKGSLEKDAACYCTKIKSIEQLTADSASVDFARGTANGILFRSNKSGMSSLYVMNGDAVSKIETVFGTANAYLSDGTVAPMASQPVMISGDLLTQYMSNPKANSIIKLALSKPRLRAAFEEYVKQNGVDPTIKNHLTKPESTPELESMLTQYGSFITPIINQDNDVIFKQFLNNPQMFSSK